MSLSASFSRLEEQEDVSAHDKLVEGVRLWKIENPKSERVNAADYEQQAQSCVFQAMPTTHQEHLDSNL